MRFCLVGLIYKNKMKIITKLIFGVFCLALFSCAATRNLSSGGGRLHSNIDILSMVDEKKVERVQLILDRSFYSEGDSGHSEHVLERVDVIDSEGETFAFYPKSYMISIGEDELPPTEGRRYIIIDL